MFYLYIEEFATTVIHMTTGTNTNRKEMMQIGVFNFAWQKNKIKLSVIFDIFNNYVSKYFSKYKTTHKTINKTKMLTLLDCFSC